MKKYMIVGLILVPTLCSAQGTFTITFEEPPVVEPGFYRLVRNYYEAGMWFRHEAQFGDIDMQLTKKGGNQTIPDNGTTYLRPSGGILLAFSLINATSFDLLSVDLSRSASSVPEPSVGSFIGYRADGSTVSTNFSVSGLDFQTYHFGPDFSDLIRVEIPSVIPVTYWSLDNVVFSTIPEPSVVVLIGLGGLIVTAYRIRKCSQH